MQAEYMLKFASKFCNPAYPFLIIKWAGECNTNSRYRMIVCCNFEYTCTDSFYNFPSGPLSINFLSDDGNWLCLWVLNINDGCSNMAASNIYSNVVFILSDLFTKNFHFPNT